MSEEVKEVKKPKFDGHLYIVEIPSAYDASQQLSAFAELRNTVSLTEANAFKFVSGEFAAPAIRPASEDEEADYVTKRNDRILEIESQETTRFMKPKKKVS